MNIHYTAQKFEQKRKRSGFILSCQTCSREFYIPPARVRQAKRNGCSVRFCSNECYVKNGDKNPFFGGKHTAEAPSGAGDERDPAPLRPSVAHEGDPRPALLLPERSRRS